MEGKAEDLDNIVNLMGKLNIEDKKFKITASGMGAHYSTQCDKYLVLKGMNSEEIHAKIFKSEFERVKDAPKRQKDIFQKGLDWEEKILDSLPDIIYFENDSTKSLSFLIDLPFSEEQNTKLMNGQSIFLYNTQFDIPPTYKSNLSREEIRFSVIRPDFLQLTKDEEGILKIFVIDAKASADMKLSHQVQVCYYIDVLKEITKNCEKVEILEKGGVWIPSSPLSSSQGDIDKDNDNKLLNIIQNDHLKIIGTIKTFSSTVMLPIIDFTLQKVVLLLQNIEKEKLPLWHFNPICSTCEFSPFCQPQAFREQKIGSIPYITHADRKWLISLINSAKIKNNNSNNNTEIEDLHLLFDPSSAFSSNYSEKIKLKTLLHIDNEGKSAAIKAVKEGSSCLVGGSLFTSLPIGQDIIICINLQMDTRLEIPYIVSVQAWENRSIDHIVDPIYSKTILLRDFDQLSFNRELVESLYSLFQQLEAQPNNEEGGQSNAKKKVQIYLFEEGEKKELYQLFVDAVLKFNTPAAHYCISQLIDDSRSLLSNSSLPSLLNDHLILPSSNDNNNNNLNNNQEEVRTRAPRIVCVLNTIRSNFSLPIAGYYSFSDCVNSFLANHVPSPVNLNPNHFYELYKSNSDLLIPEIEKRSNYLCLIILKIQNEAKNNAQLFLTRSLPWNPLPPNSLKHPILRSISFINEYELWLKYSDLISKRQSQIGSLIGNVQTIDRYSKRFEVFHGAELLEVETSTSFYYWMMVREDDLIAPLLFPDLDYLNFIGLKAFVAPAHLNRRISICKITALEYADQKVFINVSFPKEKRDNQSKSLYPKKGEKYILYLRLVDFTLKKSNKLLMELDNPRTPKGSVAAPTEFVKLMSDPIAWASLPPSKFHNLKKYYNKYYKDYSSLHNEFNSLKFTQSQNNAFKILLSSRLLITWGPPGTGKTHFIAVTILRMLKLAASNQMAFNILITANTNAAIDEMIRKLDQLRDLISKMEVDQAEKEYLNEITIERISVKEKRTKKVRPKGLFVVGCTIWKQSDILKASKFDLIIIDEGSQLPVGSAALILHRLDVGGRLLIAGDNCQLGPIFKGKYPEIADQLPIGVSIMDSLFACKGIDQFTSMLHENHRMNKSLNDFTQLIYGTKYTSQHPLQHLLPSSDPPLNNLINVNNNIENSIQVKAKEMIGSLKLFTQQSVSMSTIELSLENDLFVPPEIELNFEANLVKSLLQTLLSQCHSSHKAFVVTPHRSQRSAISQVISDLPFDQSRITVDTVDAIQGRQADIVIICYSYFDVEKINRECEFLYDRRRLNVSVSRAMSLCILITTNQVLFPSFNVLANDRCQEGLAYLSQFCSSTKNSVHNLFPVQFNNKNRTLAL